MNYEELQRRINESIYKEEARRKILKTKREEKKQIKKAGGGHAIAKAIMPKNDEHNHSTDFEFGYNTTESIDERIAREHAERCMERIECNVCGFSFGFCQELKDEKEKLKMLPTGDNAGSRKKTAGKSGINWLSTEDLSTQPQEAKILSVFYNKNGRFGARVEMKLAFNGEIIYWGVEPKKDSNSPNYKMLLEKFGPNENDWIDQRILLYVEPHKFYENQFYIRVDFPEKKTPARK